MSGTNRFLIITPVADQSGVSTATGVSITTALYTASDPIPRTQTHAWAATAFSGTTLVNAVEEPINGARDTFPNTHFEMYEATVNPTCPSVRLGQLGLTNSPT